MNSQWTNVSHLYKLKQLRPEATEVSSMKNRKQNECDYVSKLSHVMMMVIVVCTNFQHSFSHNDSQT